MIIPGISIRSRVMAKLLPSAAISKRNIGIFVVDHAPMNMSTFENPAPFFIKTAATGKAPYKGPAAAEPKAKAISFPLNPEFSPINFIKVSLGTQTSRSPRRSKIGGSTKSMVLICEARDERALSLYEGSRIIKAVNKTAVISTGV